MTQFCWFLTMILVLLVLVDLYICLTYGLDLLKSMQICSVFGDCGEDLEDMACDTFLKIVQKYKRKFVIVQKWVEIAGQARHSVDFLKDQDVIRTVLNILQELIDVEGDGMADMIKYQVMYRKLHLNWLCFEPHS
ncbi:hypothetical protein ACSBR1_008992 [Camellia fascicularis]